MVNNQILIFMFFGIFNMNAQNQSNIRLVDVKTFKSEIQNSGIQLIDVRTKEEFDKGHIKDAVLIDYYKKGFKDSLAKLDKTQPVYLYCRSGNRSGKASKILAELGFKDIVDLKGGFIEWNKE